MDDFFLHAKRDELYRHFLDVKSYWLLNPGTYWGDDLDVRYRLTFELARMEGKRILDVGSNIGVVSKYASFQNEVVGIDVEESFLIQAREAVPRGTFLRASMDKMPFADESFDVVLFPHTVPGNDFLLPGIDVEDFRYRTFKEASRVLRKDGCIVLTSPNRWWRGWKKNRFFASSEEGFLPVLYENIFLEISTFFNEVQVSGWNKTPSILGDWEKCLVDRIPSRMWRFMTIPPRLLCKISWIWEKLEDDFQKNVSSSPLPEGKAFKSVVLWAKKH